MLATFLKELRPFEDRNRYLGTGGQETGEKDPVKLFIMFIVCDVTSFRLEI